jgi:hypothetical protein
MNTNIQPNESSARAALTGHALLRRMGEEKLTREEVGIILSQWYHPLHDLSCSLRIRPRAEVANRQGGR